MQPLKICSLRTKYSEKTVSRNIMFYCGSMDLQKEMAVSHVLHGQGREELT
jgi:hypothetical protein